MIRAVDYVDLLEHSARCAGLDPDELSPSEFRDLRLFHGDRLQRIWEMRNWPEICPTEKRYFRDLYTAAETVQQGTERFYTGSQLYYQMLRTGGVSGQAPATFDGSAWNTNLAYWADCETEHTADDYDATATYVQGDKARNPDTGLIHQLFAVTSTGNAPTDTTKWGVLVDFDRYVAYAQTDETAFDQAFGAFDRDPENDGRAKPLKCFLSTAGAQVLNAVAFCWLSFRLRVPDLSGEAYDNTLVYAAGAQVYYESATVRGNFYDVVTTTVAGETPSSAAAKFSLVEIPFTFRGWLIHGAAADYARPDGNLSVADREERLAKEAQEQAVLTFDAQSAHLHQTEVLTR